MLDIYRMGGMNDPYLAEMLGKAHVESFFVVAHGMSFLAVI
jgi:hypothetical protein